MADVPVRAELVDDLAAQVRRLALAAQRVAQDFAALHDLHPTGFRALALVYEHDRAGHPISARALATELDVSPAAVTYVVDRLVASGHVVRERDPHDGRRVILRFAPHGQAVAAAYFGPLMHSHSAALAGFGDEEVARCTQMLAALATSLEGFDGSAATRDLPTRYFNG